MKPNSPAAREWAIYEFSPSFVLGFHGCDASVGEAILAGEIRHLRPSENDYDWLGSGVYFWEGNPARALQFARERAEGGKSSRGAVTRPFVLGAVINLRHCLDLADRSAIVQVKEAYESLKNTFDATGEELPTNGADLKARRLDCAVFNWLHQIHDEEGSLAYDTVRGLFWEGAEIYPGAGVREANHIQICVRNLDCILGYFRPIAPNS